ncbi:hypothetical protein Cni_G03012 [Canna indica]|uniref:DUF4283 domain-containing protein n=1 Tax=Canna indica TaxID=4628 RepID=A0AAQ3JTQ9_9LILI|nr:hypothetical protein Cni_G03012 [Canna indica]
MERGQNWVTESTHIPRLKKPSDPPDLKMRMLIKEAGSIPSSLGSSSQRKMGSDGLRLGERKATTPVQWKPVSINLIQEMEILGKNMGECLMSIGEDSREKRKMGSVMDKAGEDAEKRQDDKIKNIQEQATRKVVIAEEDIEKARKECQLVLYGKFFGKTPALELVRNLMPKLWKLNGSCKIVDLASGFFAFKFNEENYYWKVYAEGPWFLRGQALSLIQWRENFQPMKEEISVVPVWIQMPGLPLEFMNQEILLQLAAVIGRPVKIDEYTKACDRGKFARICIQMNLKKPIEQGFWVETKGYKFFQTVAYENLLNICYCCGRIGHKEEVCSQRERKENEVSVQKKSKEMASEENLLGPWVQVLKKNRKGLRRNVRVDNANRNPFTVLNNPTYEENLMGKEKDEVSKEGG